MYMKNINLQLLSDNCNFQTIIAGYSIDLEHAYKAINVSKMRLRANHIMLGFWEKDVPKLLVIEKRIN